MLQTLYGLEQSGPVEHGLMATTHYLDWGHGGFEHVGDYYYNWWPTPKRESHAWKNTEPGYHLTTDISDIEILLAKPAEHRSGLPVVTDRCRRQLVKLGYEVCLRRSRVVTTCQTLEVDVTFQGHDYSTPRFEIVKDSFETTTRGIGKYKR